MNSKNHILTILTVRKNKIMKLFFYLSIYCVFLSTLFSCNGFSLKEKANSNVDSLARPTAILHKDGFIYNKHARIYRFFTSSADSSLVCEMWYLNDSLVNSSNNSSLSLPFVSTYMSDSLMEKVRHNGTMVTYDSSTCEINGHTIWNKYEYIFHKHTWDESYIHYKAFWFEGLSDKPRKERPGYFLSEKIWIKYQDSSTTQITYNADNEIIEKMVKYYDTDEKLIKELMESFSSNDTTVYKAFYSY
jgi:hypothetical protein